MLSKYSTEQLDRARKVAVVVMDVDGVLTDGRLIYANHGDELKNFDVNDGLGIFLLRKAGIKCVILTAKASKMVRRRAKDLKIDKVYQNFHDKGSAMRDICRKFKVPPEKVCFIGDDIIDVPALKQVGLAICPANAMDEVKPFAHIVTEKRGGRGAVREVCNFILKAQGLWLKTTEKYFS